MDWIKLNTPAMCVFMPDRLADSAAHATNAAQFETFAGALLQNQFVSVHASCSALPNNRPRDLSNNSLRLPSPHGTLPTKSQEPESFSSLRAARGTYSSAPCSSTPISPTLFITSEHPLGPYPPAPPWELLRMTLLFSVSRPHNVMPRVREANRATRFDKQY